MAPRPLPILADTYLWTMNYKVGTAPMANVLCLSKPSSNAHSVNLAAYSIWTTANCWQSRQASQAQYVNSICLPLDGSGLADVVDHSLDNGGRTGAAVPPQVCAIITFRTGVRGRSHRGRMYLGGMYTADLGTPPTLWTSAAVTGLQTAATTWQAGLVTNGLTHLVLSRLLGTANPVLQYVSRPYLGTQRDRSESQIP